jgi:hypothetical protein
MIDDSEDRSRYQTTKCKANRTMVGCVMEGINKRESPKLLWGSGNRLKSETKLSTQLSFALQLSSKHFYSELLYLENLFHFWPHIWLSQVQNGIAYFFKQKSRTLLFQFRLKKKTNQNWSNKSFTFLFRIIGSMDPDEVMGAKWS